MLDSTPAPTPDTSGFYKKEGAHIWFAPNEVHSPTFRLLRGMFTETIAKEALREHPAGGWSWFDSQEEAYAFFESLTAAPPVA